MKYFAGIDIGSTTIKIVLIDDNDHIVANITCPTGSYFHKNTMIAFEGLLANNNICRDDVVYIFSTGYGRKLFKESDENISEITANTTGAKASIIGKNRFGPSSTLAARISRLSRLTVKGRSRTLP